MVMDQRSGHRAHRVRRRFWRDRYGVSFWGLRSSPTCVFPAPHSAHAADDSDRMTTAQDGAEAKGMAVDHLVNRHRHSGAATRSHPIATSGGGIG